MEHLSGGEKTMAALALLFSVHSYQPSPFFVLDEVDAALDNANVAKLVGYIRRNAGPGMQFIVISLKPGFFEGSETLVGVMRDQSINSSKTLTLDVCIARLKSCSLTLSSCANTSRCNSYEAGRNCTMSMLSLSNLLHILPLHD
jgi:energy-coupling factor transporter ATP-binding protein EcfA2